MGYLWDMFEMSPDHPHFLPAGRPLAIGRVILLAACVGLIGLLPPPGRAAEADAPPAVSASHLPPDPAVQVLAPVEVTAKRPVHDDAAAKAWRKLAELHDHPSLPKLSLISFATGEVFKYVTHIDDRSDVCTNAFEFFGGVLIPDANKLADRARDFYTRFPDHTNAIRARVWEYQSLGKTLVMERVLERIEQANRGGWKVTAQKMAYTNTLARLLPAETALTECPNLPAADQACVRQGRLERLATGPVADFLNAQTSLPAVLPKTGPLAGFLNEAVALQRDYPQSEGSYAYLPKLLEWMGEDQARALAEQVRAGSAPKESKRAFQDYLQRLKLRGKPVSLRFTAPDGRPVDSGSLKGKVVLISFYSPDDVLLNGPELLLERDAWRKFHARGLELIGVCLGRTNRQAEVAAELKAKKIIWPQRFDGPGRNSDLAGQFGIYKTPTLLLLDKQGVLREIRDPDGPAGLRDELNWGLEIPFGGNPQAILWGGLEQKIKDLLAEP